MTNEMNNLEVKKLELQIGTNKVLSEQAKVKLKVERVNLEEALKRKELQDLLINEVKSRQRNCPNCKM